MRKFKATIIFFTIVFLSISFSFAQSAINQLDTNGKRDGVWRKILQ